MTDALTRMTEFRYDACDRRTQTILPAVVAGGPKFTNSVAYDLANRRTSETNALGVLSLFGYDGVGRLLSVTNGLGSGTATNWATFAYDEAGNLTNHVDALGRATSFGYDALGRRLWRKLPGPQTNSFGYDALGNLVAMTNADNVVITNQFDLMNRLWKRWQASTLLETNTYTASGRLSSRVDSSGTNSWVYDYRDRLRTKKGSEMTIDMSMRV
jgi:YD repeat-containing protein